MHRCPRCNGSILEYSPSTGEVTCVSCGFDKLRVAISKPAPEPPRTGPQAKRYRYLSNAQKQRAVDLRASDPVLWTYGKIAAELGCSEFTVWRIWQRRSIA